MRIKSAVLIALLVCLAGCRNAGDHDDNLVSNSSVVTPSDGSDGTPTDSTNPPQNTPVPEPATLVLLGSGLAGLIGVRKFNKAFIKRYG